MINRIENEEVVSDSKAREFNFGFDTVGLPASIRPLTASARTKLVEFLGELTKAIRDGKLNSYGAIGAASRSMKQIAVECSGKKKTAIDGIEYGIDVWTDDRSVSVSDIIGSQSRVKEDFEATMAALREAFEELSNK